MTARILADIAVALVWAILTGGCAAVALCFAREAILFTRVLRQPASDEALIRTCGPCNGNPGECYCPGPCGDPHCRHIEPDNSDVLAIVCKRCNGEDGPCACAGLCGHPECVGDHTMLDAGMLERLWAMLRGGGSDEHPF